MGRPRKTVKVREAEGNRGKRPIPSIDAQLAAGDGAAPAMPRGLDGRARAAWRRLVPLLKGRLRPEDQIQLALLCRAWSKIEQAEAELLLMPAKRRPALTRGEGRSTLLVESPSGYLMQNPLLGIISTQMQLVQRIAPLFGLDPLNRLRLSRGDEIPPPGPTGPAAGPADPLEAALSNDGPAARTLPMYTN